MQYILVGVAIIILILVIVFISCYKKFQFSIIKIDEAENHIDILLKKKIELLFRTVPIINEELKIDHFLEDLDDTKSSNLNHFQLHNKLKDDYMEFHKVLFDHDSILENEGILEILDTLNDNEESLIASIKFYNDNVVVYNHLALSFPSNIIRLFFHYKKRDFYSNEKREVFEILKKK